MTRVRWAIPVLAVTFAWLVPSAYAQSIWFPRDRDRAILLEVLHTYFEDVDTDLATGSAFLGGRFALSPSATLVLELPYARVDATIEGFGSFDVNSSTVGNPYAGVELRLGESGFFTELGARAPLTSDEEGDAAFTGTYADQSRFDAFVPDYVSLHGVFNLRQVSSSGLLTRLRFGPVVMYPTEDGPFNDTELFAVFAWQIGYEGAALRVGSAISGTSLLTEDGPPLGRRTVTQFEFHADFGSGTIRPGVDLKLPIGSAASTVPVVYGISLAAAF
jgi:hypothetical protein